MNAIQAQAALASVPMPTLLAVYRDRFRACTGTVSRAQVIQHLAAHVAAGHMSVDSIRAHGAAAGAPAQAPAQAPARPATLPVGGLAPAAPDPRVDAAAQVAARAEGEALKVASRVTVLDTEASLLKAGLAKVSSEVAIVNTAVANSLSSIRAEVAALRDSGPQVRAEIAAQVAAGLAPILAQATPETAPAIVAAVAAPVGTATAHQIFGVDVRGRDGQPLAFAQWDHPEAPPVDPCHIWTEPMVRALYLAESTGRNIWLGGPAGTGKTQTAQQYAARTGRLFRRFVFTRYATGDDFLGATGMINGSTAFQPGPVLEAYTTPGAVCLLDEPGMGNPAAMSVLNGLLEGAARIAYGDRVWLRGSGNIFIGADNSLGQGDPSGRFAGVQQQNTALMDRFAFLVPCTYLPPATEAAALVQHTGCSQVLADHVIAAFGVARAKVEAGDLIDPPTFRQAIGFVQACKVLNVAEAWRVTVAARQPAESQVALAAIYSAAINESLIEGEI